MSFKHIAEVKSKADLCTGIPLRFNYRGFSVSRTNEGRGTLCFWRANKGAGLIGPRLTAMSPGQMLDSIDQHLIGAA